MLRSTLILFIILLFLAGCNAPPAPLPTATDTTAVVTVVATPTVSIPTTTGPTTTPPAVDSTQPAASATPQPGETPAQPAGSVAYIGADHNIGLVDVRSGEMRPITSDGEAPQAGGMNMVEYCCTQWSSDGQFLAFQRQEGIAQGDGYQFQYSLWIYDAASGETRSILDGQAAGFDWKPGTHLITYGLPIPQDYWSGRGQINPNAVQGLWAIDLDAGGQPYELVKAENGFSIVLPEWSPDGRRLGFDEVAFYEGRGNFAYYDFEAQKYVAWGRQTGNYDWAPDGQSLVYDLMVYTASGSERIYRYDLATNTEEQLSPDYEIGYDFSPVLSPDGQQLAFTSDLSGSDTGPFTLFVQPLTGDEPRRLGLFEQVNNLSWSPDGASLLFASGPYGQSQVVAVNPIDGNLLVLAPGSDPAWKP